ncbi:MAG: ATP-binding cassette domain-containing protein [Anaeroplasmataceae bacterium]
MIQFENVNKYIGKNKVLKDISFVIEDNDFVIINGKNGSGKTTTINLILGLLKLNKTDSGNIIDTFDSISYFPEKFMLPSLINSYEFLYTYFKDTLSSDIIMSYIEKYKLENKRVCQLSKGNQQKIVLIKTLLENSDLYIFDEPFNGLDDSSRELFIKDLMKLKDNKKAVIVVTHEPELFESDNIKKINMESGSIK